MKVAFINPPFWVYDKDGKVSRKGVRAGSRWPHTNEATHLPDKPKFGAYAPFPFFLGFAASWLQWKRRELEVVLRDSITRGESYESFYAWLEEFSPAFIFLESASPAWEHDKTVLDQIREILPLVKIVLCGPIAELPLADLLDAGAYAVIKGEYEKGCVDAVVGNRGLINRQLLNQEEMNAAPIPMYDHECISRYWDANPKGMTSPHVQIWSSRGCFAKCSFCIWPAVMTGDDPDGQGRRMVKFYSPAYIERWIDFTRQAITNLSCVYFDDDTFNLSDKHVLGICEVMRKTGLPWFAMCRADTIEWETWEEMARSGCKGVKIGIESGSQRVLNEIVNKRLNLDDAVMLCSRLESIGIRVHTTWTTGLPGETPGEKVMTLSLISAMTRDGRHSTYQLSNTAEIEGTPLSHMKEGEALTAYPGAVKDENYRPIQDGALPR